jgi:hypothetical protein
MGIWGFFRRANTSVKDPTAGLRSEVLADPENDQLEDRVIQKERDDIERDQQGFLND